MKTNPSSLGDKMNLNKSQTWDQWLTSFESMELRFYGFHLKGEERHGTLYGLFNDGYPPKMAFDLIQAAARLDRLKPVTIAIILITIIAAAFTLGAIAVGEYWKGSAIVAALGGLYIQWVRMKIRSISRLASQKIDTSSKGETMNSDSVGPK